MFVNDVASPSLAEGEVTLEGAVPISGWFHPIGGANFDLLGSPLSWRQDAFIAVATGQFSATTSMGLTTLTFQADHDTLIVGQLWDEVILPAEAPPLNTKGSGQWVAVAVSDISSPTALLLLISLSALQLTPRLKCRFSKTFKLCGHLDHQALARTTSQS
jgi:hypothetical protein